MRTLRLGPVFLVILVACSAGEPDATSASTILDTSTTAAPTTTATSKAPPLTSTTLAAWSPPQHRVGIVAGAFVDRASGEAFVPRGVNYLQFSGGRDAFFSPDVFDERQIDADFGDLAELGYNTVRLFVDSCDVGPGCMTQMGRTGLDADYLDVVARVLQLAKDNGLVLLLTANDLPDGGGYRQLSARDDSAFFPGYRNSDFLTESGHEAMVLFWNDLLSGLVERRAALDAVLGWSILNEHWLFKLQPPLSLTEGTVTTAAGTYDMAEAGQRRAMVVESTRAMIAAVAAEIRRHDPGALVTMGFFAPQFPNETGIGGDWYVDTAPLVESSDLDFFDFHAYAGEDITIEQIAENFGVADGKPVVMGEVGAFTERYPVIESGALAVQDWVARSCAVGFDGWLQWAFHQLPMSDATWGFTDDGGYLMDVLAPSNQPDPCTRTLVDPNLAAGRPATASGSLDGNPPGNAVDGNPGTAWVSGADAPQWIEIDLGTAATVGGLRLRVDQDPAGPTRHIVEVRDGDGALREAHTFEGATSYGDLLEVTFDSPIDGVIAVRITTTASPSWIAWADIEVLAG